MAGGAIGRSVDRRLVRHSVCNSLAKRIDSDPDGRFRPRAAGSSQCEIVRDPKVNFPNPKPQGRLIDRRSRLVRMLRHICWVTR